MSCVNVYGRLGRRRRLACRHWVQTYADGDVEEVEDVDLRRVLEGPVLVVARRRDVLSDIVSRLANLLYETNRTPGVDTGMVVVSRMRKCDKTCGG